MPSRYKRDGRLGLPASAQAALYAHAEAQRYFEQALALTSDPREAAELHERAGDAARVGLLGPEAADEHLRVGSRSLSLDGRPAEGELARADG